MEDTKYIKGVGHGKGEEKPLTGHVEQKTPKEILAEMKRISGLISEGAITFLKQEYLFLGIFVALFAILLSLTAEIQLGQFYTTIAYIVGGSTSILAGYIGMRIATYTNVRTTYQCCEDIHKGFVVAYRGGQVLGFVLVGLALLILQIMIIIYRALYLNS